MISAPEEIVLRMTFADGRIHLPSGVSYRHLVLPRNGRLTLPVARKVEELRKQGAAIFLQAPITGTPGLEGYPQADEEVRKLAAAWPLLPKGGWNEVFAKDQVAPDFEGEGLKWIHRRTGNTDIYFVANTRPEPLERECVFRVDGKDRRVMGSGNRRNPRPPGCLTGQRTHPRHAAFRSRAKLVRRLPRHSQHPPIVAKPLCGMEAAPADRRWLEPELRPRMGNQGNPQARPTRLLVRSLRPAGEILLRHRHLSQNLRTGRRGAREKRTPLRLDLGQVEVVARVKVNGKDCGIAWKPPYQVDVTHALRPGSNTLEIEVANTWVNRLIGDEQLPLDSKWKDRETLLEWPQWFKKGQRAPGGRFTFTTNRHYTKNSPLQPAGLLGPVRILSAR